MKPNFILMQGGQVISRAKAPGLLNFDLLNNKEIWSVCLKATDFPDDSGLYGCVAAVTSTPGGKVIWSEGVGCNLPDARCITTGSVIQLVKNQLQSWYIRGLFDTYNDLPAIRVIPV